MKTSEMKPAYWCSASIRICHPELDPTEVSQMLDSVPQIAQRPGESRVPHGACKSAGYWCIVHRVEYPDLPDSVFVWADQFVRERESHFRRLLENGCDIDVYIGIHASVLALGFKLPATPTIWRLSISVGLEFFSA
jgi:hypothetical protein